MIPRGAGWRQGSGLVSPQFAPVRQVSERGLVREQKVLSPGGGWLRGTAHWERTVCSGRKMHFCFCAKLLLKPRPTLHTPGWCHP